MDYIDTIVIFFFGTEKMGVYKISTGRKLEIIPVDIPPLLENRIVYSAQCEFASSG